MPAEDAAFAVELTGERVEATLSYGGDRMDLDLFLKVLNRLLRDVTDENRRFATVPLRTGQTAAVVFVTPEQSGTLETYFRDTAVSFDEYRSGSTMSDCCYVEFLYDDGSAIDLAREVCDAFESGTETKLRPYPKEGEFPDADKVSIVIHHGDASYAYSGELRPFDPDDESHPGAAPTVPCLELLLTTEELTWDGYPVAEEVSAILELVKAVYEATDTPPAYAYWLYARHPDRIRRGHQELPVTEVDLTANRIRDVSWLMLFPPAMVETYGREFLLDAPVWRAQELDDGAVLLVVVENPFELGQDALDPLYGYFELSKPEWM